MSNRYGSSEHAYVRQTPGRTSEHQKPARPPAQRHPDPRPPQAHRRAMRAADYTLGHAGRQVRLGPVAFWIVVGTLVVMAGWSVATGTYFAFHDDVLKRLIARQTEMQFAYEDRIAELRAQVDRVTSRQLLDQEQFEQKLDQIVRKQTLLEQRASTLHSLGDPTITGSIKPAGRTGAAETSRPKASPINDITAPRAVPDREARMDSRFLSALASHLPGRRAQGGVESTLLRIQSGLERVEQQQMAALTAMEEKLEARVRRMRGVLAELGLEKGKPLADGTPLASAVGGPFVPVQREVANFDRQVYKINLARTNIDRLTRTLASIPIRQPVFGEIDMSSPFGMRMDPFLKGPAIHTGIDMRGDTGDPVRATANGTVTIAGVNGGYGKMIEIDHGNDIATRYGHLSEIDVKVGQSVKLGQIIGKIGSTGRSTGPHLHYETRIDGEAVNPEKYLRAGMRLAGN
ncbi:MAG: peptidoglycan DD-metalloendopeptidase family protein [Pseudorhodoplanes sp.]|nr:peptidoglycan DD-metalloendopeptidase family protein [Pseudorhodoplanes sp.]